MSTVKSKVLYVSAAVLGMLGASAVTANAAYKTVTVQDNSTREILHEMTFGTVQEFLHSENISYAKGAKISPKPSTKLQDGMDIVIQDPKQVTISDGEHVVTYSTFARTVSQLFQEQGIKLGVLDRVNVPISSALNDGEEVKIQRIRREVSVREKTIPFQTVRQQTTGLYKGQTKVLTHGVKGKKKITVTTVTINGRVASRNVRQKVVVKPVSEVVQVGAKLQPVHLASRSFNPLSGNVKTIHAEVTAYVAGGRTATGRPAVPGVAAVDPATIPYGSKILVPGFGTVIAEDTGAAMSPTHIDICVSTRLEAMEWGVRWLTLKIVE